MDTVDDILIQSVYNRFPKLRKDLNYIQSIKDVFEPIAYEYSRLMFSYPFLCFSGLIMEEDSILLLCGNDRDDSLWLNLETGDLFEGDKKYRTIREWIKDRIDHMYALGRVGMEDIEEQKKLKSLWKRYRRIFKV